MRLPLLIADGKGGGLSIDLLLRVAPHWCRTSISVTRARL
jgi:hypothetical protein